MTAPDPIVEIHRCSTCGDRVQAIAWREPEDDRLLAYRAVFVPGGEYVAKPCGHPFRWPAKAGVVFVLRPSPSCRHCHRTIEWVDGVGWIHIDTRVYFVPEVEPKCDAAEPEDTPPVRPRD
jgi:hypothetical protein